MVVDAGGDGREEHGFPGCFCFYFVPDIEGAAEVDGEGVVLVIAFWDGQDGVGVGVFDRRRAVIGASEVEALCEVHSRLNDPMLASRAEEGRCVLGQGLVTLVEFDT